MLHVLLLSPCQLSSAATMKSLILVAVILQLVIIGIKSDGKYQFGDIIEFPRKYFLNKPVYSHFAVYVGPESGVNVSQGDNDIFHRLAQKEKRYICEFGKFDETRGKSNDEKMNYLDDEIPAENRTTDKIKERIKQKKEECGKYKLITNNCEHLATFVRYGIAKIKQKGTHAGCALLVANNIKEVITKKYEAVMKRTIQETDENNNTLFTSDAHKQVSVWPVLSACLALFFCHLSGSCDF